MESQVKPEELKNCLKRLNMTELQLGKLIGFKKAKTITQAQARCIRALVLHEDVRSEVFKFRDAFPDLEFTAIRSLEADDKR